MLDADNLGKENKEGMEELKAEAQGEEAPATTDSEMTSESETEEGFPLKVETIYDSDGNIVDRKHHPQ